MTENSKNSETTTKTKINKDEDNNGELNNKTVKDEEIRGDVNEKKIPNEEIKASVQKPVDLDEVLAHELGQFGWFQIRNILLVAYPIIICGLMTEYIFSAAATPHRWVYKVYTILSSL